MDIDLNGFQIPIASLALLDTLGVLLLIPIMDKLVYPFLDKVFGIRPSQLQRIGVGMIVATASMACAGGIEWFRVEHCCMYQDRVGGDVNGTQVANITIFYQVPQYFLIGLSEVFTSITGKGHITVAFVHVERFLLIEMDNFHYRLIFDLGKSRQQKRNSRKELFKRSKIPEFGREML